MPLPQEILRHTPIGLINDLERAVSAVRAAGAAILATPAGEIGTKSGPRDIVTAADGAAERAAIGALALRPDETLCAEESQPSALPKLGRVWTIDPLDGTMNFAHGIPFFGPAVALVVNGRPLVAATYDPLRDELFLASDHGKSWLVEGSGRVTRLSSHHSVAERAVCYTGLWNGGDALIGEAILAHGATLRSLGASAIGLAWAAAGRFDLFAQRGHLWPWDVAGGLLLCREAGMSVRQVGFGAGDGACTVLAAAPALDRLAEELTAPLGLPLRRP